MLYKLNHEQATSALKLALEANIVAFLKSQPAMGKSSIVKQLANQMGLELIDLRLTQLQPYDLAGLVYPNKEKDNFKYLPLDLFPLETDAVPDGKKGWLLFLDEFNSADRYTAAAAYKLLLDREIGNYKLHSEVRIICAGNNLTDGAIANNLGTAIQSRVIHLELDLDSKQWLNWLAKQKDWNNLIYTFLNFRPETINNFDPEKEVITYASPRTWELLSKQLNAGLLELKSEVYTPIIMGTVGDTAGYEFISFLEIYSTLPSIDDIIADPNNCKLPDNISAKWALGAYLANNINSSNEDSLLTYINRIKETDIRVVAQRALVKKYPQVSNNKILQKSALELRNQLANY